MGVNLQPGVLSCTGVAPFRIKMNPDVDEPKRSAGAEKKCLDSAAWHQCILVCILVGFLAVACYANSLWGDFVFDDVEAILNNEDVDPFRSGLRQVFQNDFWGTKISSNLSHKSYRPLTVITFRLNYWLGGGFEPFGFHLVNILLHTLVSLLYLEVCTAICKKSTLDHVYMEVAPAIAALLFAIHPIHTENVSNVSIAITELNV